MLVACLLLVHSRRPGAVAEWRDSRRSGFVFHCAPHGDAAARRFIRHSLASVPGAHPTHYAVSVYSIKRASIGVSAGGDKFSTGGSTGPLQWKTLLDSTSNSVTHD